VRCHLRIYTKEKKSAQKVCVHNYRKCKGLMLYIQEALTNNYVVESVVNGHKSRRVSIVAVQ